MDQPKPLNIQSLWEDVLDSLKTHIPEAHFNTWLSGSHPVRIDDKCLVVGVGNDFTKNWVQQKYIGVINTETCKKVPGIIRSVKLIVSKRSRAPKSTTANIPANTELQLETVDKTSNLNPRFSFETFVVAPFNNFAHAVAQTTVNKPATNCNPLFIYGPSGVGKTHLIQAMGNRFLSLYRSVRVLYVTAGSFSDDYTMSVCNNTRESFLKKYQNTDVLIIDDIHGLEKKKSTTMELFHLFNELHNQNKQIIFSSDRPPSEIEFIDQRMRTRFSSGMILDIGLADREDLEIVLTKKAESMDLQLDKETTDFILENVNSNIRELEGTLKGVSLYKEIHGPPITLEKIKAYIRNNLQTKSSLNIKEVVERVCEFYEISQSLVCAKSRKRTIVLPRQVIMYILREYMETPYSTIGKRLGGRDHTTVIHAVEKIKREIDVNKVFQREIEQIRRKLDLI